MNSNHQSITYVVKMQYKYLKLKKKYVKWRGVGWLVGKLVKALHLQAWFLFVSKKGQLYRYLMRIGFKYSMG